MEPISESNKRRETDMAGWRMYDSEKMITKRLEEQVAQQAAVIEQIRKALTVVDVSYFMNTNHQKVVSKALALQPCPEVLNRVRADAVREAAESLNRVKGSAWISVVAACAFILREAQRIEQGEA